MLKAPVLLVTLGFVVAIQSQGDARTRQAQPAAVPLCAGLTIVTAITQPQGDYESIKRVESFGAEGLRIRYSSYRPDPKGDYDSTTVAPPPWIPFTVYRTVNRADLEHAEEYMQQFAPEGVPEVVPGTTALGISKGLYRRLKAEGRIALTVYQPILTPLPVPRQPGDLDYRFPGEISRVEPRPVSVPVLVNDRPVSLPAVHARGTFLWDEAEFFFLDDPQNPLSLKFTIGNEQLRVIKISYDCEGAAPRSAGRPADGAGSGTGTGGGGGLGTGGGSGIGGDSGAAGDRLQPTSPTGAAMESALAQTGKVDVYSIYFDFNSDRIREESEPTLADIARVLERHPDWGLTVNGHTDNVASDGYNLELSKRRATAVKDALVRKYRIAATRLSTAGFGESHPADTNDTVEGRARNRRVELVRM